MSTGFTLSGTNLRNLAYNMHTVDGWDSFPSARTSRTQYPFRHGEIISTETFYNARDISLGMLVLPFDPTTGTVTSSPLQHIQENLDTLFGLFGQPGNLPLIRTMPDGSQRQSNIKVIETFDVAQHVGDTRIFVARLRMAMPFWAELPVVSLPNQSGSIVLVNNGNAPVGDFSIHFDGAGSITHSSLGDSMVATGEATVSMYEWSITDNSQVPADNLVTCNSPWMFRLVAGNNSLSITGSVDITYYHSWF